MNSGKNRIGKSNGGISGGVIKFPQSRDLTGNSGALLILNFPARFIFT